MAAHFGAATGSTRLLQGHDKQVRAAQLKLELPLFRDGFVIAPLGDCAPGDTEVPCEVSVGLEIERGGHGLLGQVHTDRSLNP